MLGNDENLFKDTVADNENPAKDTNVYFNGNEGIENLGRDLLAQNDAGVAAQEVEDDVDSYEQTFALDEERRHAALAVAKDMATSATTVAELISNAVTIENYLRAGATGDLPPEDHPL